MLFITTAEIFKRSPTSKVYFATTKKINKNEYAFEKMRYDSLTRHVAMGDAKSYRIALSTVKDTVKFIIGQRDKILWEITDLKKLMPRLDLIIDISGFAIGQKWAVKDQEIYLDGIRLAQKYSVPMVMMPQSFGPFDYDEERKFLLDEIAELLPYPDMIFAREKEGYDALRNTFHLSNVQLSSDLVLQNSGFDVSLVMKEKPVFQIPDIDAQNAVAIIPNQKCFYHGNRQNVLNCYKVIIGELLKADKEIYIFRHSGEDLDACRNIFAVFKGNPHVHLLEHDFSCLEYDALVKKFNFIICSRYHGIVHAYRNSIPAIILGWAIKYVALAEQVSQGQYVFNIVDENVDYVKLEEVTRHMIQNYPENAHLIAESVSEIQRSNCFDFLKNYL